MHQNPYKLESYTQWLFHSRRQLALVQVFDAIIAHSLIMDLILLSQRRPNQIARQQRSDPASPYSSSETTGLPLIKNRKGNLMCILSNKAMCKKPHYVGTLKVAS